MGYNNPRIKLDMSVIDMIIAMSKGIPGAATVLMMMMENGAKIDPDSMMGEISGILALDTHDIYESRIWMLYKDVCKQNINHTLALLRAVQLGYLSEEKLSHAIDNYGEGINIPELLAKVKERLPKFQIDKEQRAA